MPAPRLNLKVTPYRTHSGNYMKTMNKTLAWMMAAALSVVLVSNATAQDAKQRTGKVVRIKGDARYSTGNKVWQPLKVGTVLKSGHVVQTAANSFVDVVVKHLKKGDRVRIGGLGIMQVKKRPARMGRNPATGEQIKIKASKKVAFRASKELKEAI